MPGESLQTAKESGKFLGQIAAKLRVPLKKLFGYTDIFYAIPLVGTPLYEYGKNLGLIGNSVEEEEKYLKLVSNVGAYKRYYINFNGAPMSEVVFWDILVFLEANKTYKELMKGKSINQKMMDRLSSMNVNQDKNQSMIKKNHEKDLLKNKSNSQIFGGGGGDNKTHFLSKNFVTNFIKEYISFNETIAKWVPRFILYPTVRYMLYVEYLLQKYLYKDTNNIHKITNSKVNSSIRLEDELFDTSKTSQIDRSLRSIVKKKFHDQRFFEKTANDHLVGGP